MRIKEGEQAPNCRLLRPDGQAVTLSELLQGGMLLLVFQRHLGCPFAKRSFHLLNRYYKMLGDRKVNLVSVAPAEPSQISQFCSRNRIWTECLCDPDGSAAKAFGVRRANPLDLLHPGCLWQGARQTLRGNLPSGIIGDPTRMMAAFGIDTDGTVFLAWRARHMGDLPNYPWLVNEYDAYRDDAAADDTPRVSNGMTDRSVG